MILKYAMIIITTDDFEDPESCLFIKVQKITFQTRWTD